MRGIAVAPEPMAAEVAAEILESGGNAFDAAVAAAFMQCVFNPFQCGLGGWGGAVLHQAVTGHVEYLGFEPTIGSGMSPDMWTADVRGFTDVWNYALFDDHRNMYGYTAIMTPGTVAGLGSLHQRFGTMPWADLIAPSIEWSESGFVWPEYIAQYTRRAYLKGLPHPKDKYCATPGARALFMRDDTDMLEPGDHYRNVDQANSLRAIAEHGPGEFYTGGLADTIIEDFERNGAFVTREDLSGYQPWVDAPIEGSYRGHRIATSALPGGGLLLVQMLKVLEQFDLSSEEYGGVDHYYLLGAAMSWAAVTRFRHLQDPGHGDVPVDELLGDEYIGRIVEAIRGGRLPESGDLDPSEGTTHICVVDESGNSVSLTHTLTSCSGVVVPGTGFTWNDCVALMDPRPGRPNSYVPGRRRASAISPAIVFRNDTPWLVLGAPGGWSVTSGVLQTLVNILDFGLTPTEAVSAYSHGCTVRDRRSSARVARFPSTRAERVLRGRGMIVVEQSLHNYHASFARPQCIVIDDGVYRAASDPRSDGGSAVLARFCYSGE
jgi:gamma-glutamyltranspeptidase / glutathione hydrolase